MPKDDMISQSVPEGNGNSQFMDLYKKHEQAFFIIAKKLSSPLVAPEDVMQESLMRALKYFKSLQDEAKFKRWFSRIIYRAFLELLEKANAEKRRGKEHAHRNPRRHTDSEIDLIDVPIPTTKPQDADNNSDPSTRMIPMSETSPNPPPSPNEIFKEVIREGVETFHEVKDDSDFLPWIYRISKKIREKMHGKHINPEKEPPDVENDEEE